jgi:1-deoxy-D-xylulose-5-phosphate reductoisomerase
MKKKLISILGSTGSIGLTSLDIVNKKKNNFKLNLLSANRNYSLICKQINKYNPNYFLINDSSTFIKIKKKYKKKKIKILNFLDNNIFKKKSDITISAIPGIAGLEPTIIMTKLSKKILIANKEAVICGWNLIKNAAIKNKTEIVPIDSEHFSIFKLIENQKKTDIKKIFITASGGPFLNFKPSKLKNIKPKEALNHPKWKMGKKITIDSSTLMNKIFELIEAQKLFDLDEKKIDILIHPESLVHAIVVLKNGLIKFIYHDTSMIIPLVNAIFDGDLNIDDFYKFKIKTNKKNYLDNLTFKKVDKKIFPSINLKKRLNEYPSTSIIINACNEILVDQFLQKNIPFLSISKIINNILNDKNYKKYAIRNPLNIKQILEINDWAKNTTLNKYVKKF